MKLLADIRKNRGGAEREFSGLLDCCSKTFKKDGALGIYRGFGASVLTVFTFRAFYFGYTDRLTQRLRCRKKVHLGLIRKTEEFRLFEEVSLSLFCYIGIVHFFLAFRHDQEKTNDGT